MAQPENPSQNSEIRTSQVQAIGEALHQQPNILASNLYEHGDSVLYRIRTIQAHYVVAPTTPATTVEALTALAETLAKAGEATGLAIHRPASWTNGYLVYPSLSAEETLVTTSVRHTEKPREIEPGVSRRYGIPLQPEVTTELVNSVTRATIIHIVPNKTVYDAVVEYHERLAEKYQAALKNGEKVPNEVWPTPEDQQQPYFTEAYFGHSHWMRAEELGFTMPRT